MRNLNWYMSDWRGVELFFTVRVLDITKHCCNVKPLRLLVHSYEYFGHSNDKNVFIYTFRNVFHNSRSKNSPFKKLNYSKIKLSSCITVSSSFILSQNGKIFLTVLCIINYDEFNSFIYFGSSHLLGWLKEISHELSLIFCIFL